MVYDAAREVCVLYGGSNVQGCGSLSDETWEWNGMGWSLRPMTIKPPPLTSYCMAYDSDKHVTVQVAGFTLDCTETNQTWLYGPDSDDDGNLDAHDNCPLVYNPDQADSDDDGVGDVCDNCPYVPNPGQENCGGDLYGDVCDPDIDGDGVLNEFDVCPNTPGCEVLADGRTRLDLNNDCEVNGLDIQIIVEQLLNGCSECPHD